MTKLIISLFFLLVCLNKPFAQVDNVTGQFVDKGNLLQSPGAESGKKGWTNSAGTFTVESTGAIKGGRVFKVALSSQTLNLYQDSTSYASEFNDSVQGIAYAYVKTSVSGIKLCAKKAGVTQTSLCMSHSGSGKYELLKVPFILGSTSNGLAIISDSAKTGNVFVDETYVGAVDLKVDGQTVNIQSSSLIQTVSFSLGATITGAITSSVNSGLYSYNSSTGIYTVLKKSKFVISGSSSTAGNSSHIINVNVNGSIVSSGSSPPVTGYHASTAYTGILNVGDTFYFNIGTNGSSAQKLSVSATEFVDSGTYSSTNADTDWQSCGYTASDFIGFGTVTDIDLKCKRQGGDLLINGGFRSGTPTSSEARLALKFNGQSLNVKSGYLANTIFGIYNINTTTASNLGIFHTISASGLSYIGFSARTSSVSPLEFLIGTSAGISGQKSGIDARIPIESWENSNIIIGTFNGLEKCENTLDCTDTFSASVSSTGAVVVGSENVDWLNGNCTITTTGHFSCPIITGIFTATPNCFANFNSTPFNSIGADVYSATTSAALIRVNENGAAANRAFTITCQKARADYIGKTAKAVASDQNLRTPGLTNAVICSAQISSTGAISNQKGGCFESCTNATTPVCTFTNNYWASTPNCWSKTTSSALDAVVTVTGTTSMSGALSTTTGSAASGSRAYFCHGETNP